MQTILPNRGGQVTRRIRKGGALLTIIISLVLGTAVGAGVSWFFGLWYTGVAPGLLVAGLTFFGLFRYFTRVVQGQMGALPALLQARDLDGAERLLTGIASSYGRWVLLLEKQISAQRGMLQYAQMKFDKARPLLEHGTAYNWQARLALGCIAYREKSQDDAWDQFQRAIKVSAKEAMIYVVWSVLAVRAGDREAALKVLSDGLNAIPDSQLLKDLRAKVANKERIKTADLPEAWYHFFPEDMVKEMMVKGRRGGPPKLPDGVQPRYQMPYPQPRGASKKARRG